MRYPTIPEDVVLVPATADRPAFKMSMLEFVSFLVNGDSRFNKTGPGIRMGSRIEEAYRAKKVGEAPAIQDEDWKLLCEVSEAPEQGYPVLTVVGAQGSPQQLHVERSFLPFLDSIKDAPTEEVVDSAPKKNKKS